MVTKLRYWQYELVYRHAFGVSSNTRKTTTSIFIEINFNNLIGLGEACLPAYLGESVDETLAFVKRYEQKISSFTLITELQDFVLELDAIENCYAAKAALNMALIEVISKCDNKPIYEYLNLEKPFAKLTSFTIGIDKEKVLEQKIKEATDFTILKIKAGTQNDFNLIKTIRKYTDKLLYIDANQGWKEFEEAKELLYFLKENNVALVEQPFKINELEKTLALKELKCLPIIADEAIKNYTALVERYSFFDGINIKLMKCGGLTQAKKMIDFAKEKKIKIMLGCMAESSCGVNAMSNFLAYADYVDLDAPLLLSNDSFGLVKYKNGEILT